MRAGTPLLVCFVLLAGGGVHAQSLQQGLQDVTVLVELSCPSCAAGLERRLGRLDDVAAVEVLSDTGRVVVTPTPGAWVDPDAVREVVRNAGFEPDAIVLTAVGRVVEIDGAPALELSDEVAILFAAGDLTEALVSEAGGQVVTVTGEMQASPSGVAATVRVGKFHVQ